MPPAIKSVPYAPVGDIKFIGKKGNASVSCTSDSLCYLQAKKYDARTVLPTQSESDELFSSLAKFDMVLNLYALLAIASP